MLRLRRRWTRLRHWLLIRWLGLLLLLLLGLLWLLLLGLLGRWHHQARPAVGSSCGRLAWPRRPRLRQGASRGSSQVRTKLESCAGLGSTKPPLPAYLGRLSTAKPVARALEGPLGLLAATQQPLQLALQVVHVLRQEGERGGVPA